MPLSLLTKLFKLIVLTTVMWMYSQNVHAQNVVWSANYGGVYTEEAYSGVRTSDGGYAILGSTYSFGAGDHDIYLLRLDSHGDTLWSRTYGGLATEYGYDIQLTGDGGFVVVGVTYSYGAGDADVWLLRLDFMGGIVWSHTFGGAGKDTGRSVRVISGGFLIGGGTSSFGHGYDDFYLLRTNSLGDTLWTRAYGGGGGEVAFATRPTPDGGFVMCGATGSFGVGYSSMYVVKTDSNGDTLWTTTYGGSRADMGYGIEVALDGGLIMVGATASYGAGEYDIYLVKTDPDGFLEWEATYGGAMADQGFSVRPVPDGGYLIAGTTASFGSGKFDGIAIRTNPIGTVEWQRTYGGTKSDYCYYSVTDNNAWVLIGHTFSYGAGGSDVFINKITADGATSVDDNDEPLLPEDFILSQNYPNPFNLSTTIEFTLAQRGDVVLTVYNILGQTVREWRFGEVPSGPHSVVWNGLDCNGFEVASGIYLYSLRADTQRLTKKMVLLK
jgi:hypothetical protein